MQVITNDLLDIEEILPTIDKVKNTIIHMSENLQELKLQLDTKEQQLNERESKLEESVQNSNKLQEEYLSVQTELNKISSLYKDLQGQKLDATNVRKILSIYVSLLEKVFQGRPHAQILFLLHGEQHQMSRQDLTKATGFEAAVVLHSIHELHSANLIEYNEDNGVVTLKERLYH